MTKDWSGDDLHPWSDDSGAPALQPGQVLLATVEGAAGGLIWLGGRPANTPMFAISTWVDAGTALSTALPFVFGEIPSLSIPQSARRIAGDATDWAQGPSFGLAFVLAQVSLHYRIPMPADWIAIGEVKSNGTVSDAGGLEQKLNAVRRCAPRVRRVVAHPGARARVPPDWANSVTEVETAADAVLGVFEDRIQIELHASIADVFRRRAMIDSLFSLALRDRSRLLSWKGVARLAELILAEDRARQLDDRDRLRLECARAIAHRHDGVYIAMPDIISNTSFWASLEGEQALGLSAHLLQHHADTGQFSGAEIGELVSSRLSSGRPSSQAGAALLGAYARLLGAEGSFEKALKLTLSASEYWCSSGSDLGLSYPLSYGYYLSAASLDADTFRALELRRRFYSIGQGGGPYVLLARLLAAAFFERSGASLVPRAELERELLDWARNMVVSDSAEVRKAERVPDFVCEGLLRVWRLLGAPRDRHLEELKKVLRPSAQSELALAVDDAAGRADHAAFQRFAREHTSLARLLAGRPQLLGDPAAIARAWPSPF